MGPIPQDVLQQLVDHMRDAGICVLKVTLPETWAATGHHIPDLSYVDANTKRTRATTNDTDPVAALARAFEIARLP